MINFRKVTRNDFKMLYFWQNTTHVKKFWDSNDNFTYEEICNKYSKRLDEGKINLYIFSIDNVDIGFIQSYSVDKLDSYKVSGITKGIDIYIGDPNYVYKGHGKLIIRQFIQYFIFNDVLIEYVVVDPEVRNKSAIKAYKKAGFRHVNTAYNEYEKTISYYMVLSRDNFFCNY